METEETPCSKCQHLGQLKNLAAQVVIQYEELQRKFAENEYQYSVVVKRLKEREQQMEQMKRLIEPAIQEHERLKMRYNIEAGCRKEAQFFASKINQQNKELKRQSNMLMSKVKDIDISSLTLDPIDNSDSYKEYTDELNKTVSDLKEEVASLTADLLQSKEELEIEKEKLKRLTDRHDVTQKRLKQNQDVVVQYQEALEELSKVSEAAYVEYNLLKEKCELEHKRASDIRIQNEAMKKQSAIFLTNNMPSEQLQEALMEVDKLTLQLEEQKIQLQSQISELQSELDSIKDPEKLQEVEGENSKLLEEREDLMKKLEDYDKQYKELQAEYKVLEKKLEDLKSPPPPPPPPPPPIMPAAKGKGFLSKMIGGKKKKPPAGAAQGDDTYKKAVDEMMKVIRSGKTLKKVLRPTGRRENEEESDSEKLTEDKNLSESKVYGDPSESGLEEKSEAMTELHSILHRFKRTQSESDLTSLTPLEASGEESDLARTFKKIKQGSPARDLEPAQNGEVVLRNNSSEVVMRKQPSQDKSGARSGPILSAVEEERNSVASNAPKEDDGSVFQTET